MLSRLIKKVNTAEHSSQNRAEWDKHVMKVEGGGIVLPAPSSSLAPHLPHNTVYSDIYQCVKCKKKKTSFIQVQTRSADEGMTVFVKCQHCGFKWRDT